jgi:hypothetical protein
MPQDNTFSGVGNGNIHSVEVDEKTGESVDTDPNNTYSGLEGKIQVIGDDDKGDDDKEGDAGKCDAGKKSSSCVILGGRITKRKRSKYRLNKRKSRLKRKKQVPILRRRITSSRRSYP